VVEELSRSLLSYGNEVMVADIRDSNRQKCDLPIVEVWVPGFLAGTDVHLGLMHKVKRVTYSVALVRTLKNLIRKSDEKIILHFHNQYNLFFFLKLVPQKIRKKAILAYTIHSYIWQGEWNAIEQTIRQRYFQEIVCCEKADVVFALNRDSIKNLQEHTNIVENKLHLIINGVNTDTYAPLDDSEKVMAHRKYNLVGKKVFLQVGSVCDRKNQLEGVRLLLPLLQKDESIVYVYAGGIISPEYQEQINKYASENGVSKQVIYAGELEPGKPLNEYYNMALATVFPSKLEGFSLVVTESLSSGTPVMISGNSKFDVGAGCLCYRDPEHFVRLVEAELLNEQKLRENSMYARENVIKNFSWNKAAGLYLDVFQRLTGKEGYS